LIKNILQLTVQVCCSFYFLHHCTFFEEDWDFWWVLLFFSSGLFKKSRVVFLVGSNYIKPEDNYGHLINFLSQVSKLTYFNVLGLADFMMHHWFPVSFFVLIQPHTCAFTMCIVSRFVSNWHCRGIGHNDSHKPVSTASFPLSNYNSHMLQKRKFS